MTLDVRPQMENGFFAEIYGADLTRCDDSQFDEIRQAHLRHGVIVIRDQHHLESI